MKNREKTSFVVTATIARLGLVALAVIGGGGLRTEGEWRIGA